MSNPAHAASDTYKPIFSDKVRTIVYIAGLVVCVIGTAFTTFGNPQVGDWLTSAGGLLAAGFGVAYNPVRLASRL
jgi:hypothetical protein